MNYINIGIVVTALLSIVFVLLQDRGSEGGAFTSGDMGGFYQQRRGVEKAMFAATILSVAAFATFSLLRLTHLGNTGTANSNTPVEIKTDNPNVKVDITPTGPATTPINGTAPAPSTGSLAPATGTGSTTTPPGSLAPAPAPAPAPAAPAPAPAK